MLAAIMDSQITRSDMFGPLLQADPSFFPKWEAFCAEWADEAEPPLYVALGDLAAHLIERLSRGDTESFGRVFAVVEQWHVRGDAYVAEAASIGLLESIQNTIGGNASEHLTRGGVRAADFQPWLGPETKRWWDKLYRYWDGEHGALQPDT